MKMLHKQEMNFNCLFALVLYWYFDSLEDILEFLTRIEIYAANEPVKFLWCVSNIMKYPINAGLFGFMHYGCALDYTTYIIMKIAKISLRLNEV